MDQVTKVRKWRCNWISKRFLCVNKYSFDFEGNEIIISEFCDVSYGTVPNDFYVRKAQAEVEKKNEKPMTNRMFKAI